MKNCPKCGQENEDEFVFCCSCGARIDGKKECPSCHKTIPEDLTYCGYCGKRADGKVVCPNCKTANEQDLQYCTNCGQALKAEKSDDGKKGSRENKVYQLVAKIIGICLPVLFLIAMFLPLVSAHMTISSGPVNVNVSIFSFLKKLYFDQIKALNDTVSQEFAGGLAWELILPIIIISLGILSIAATSIISIVKNAMALNNKDEDSHLILPSATALCYFGMAFGIAFCSGLGTDNAGTSVQLGAMPIIMVVLSILAVIALLVLRLCLFGKKTKNAYVSFGLRSGSFLLSLIAIFLFCGCAVSATYDGTSVIFPITALITVASIDGSVIDFTLTILLFTLGAFVAMYLVFAIFYKLFRIDQPSKTSYIISSSVQAGLILVMFILTAIVISPEVEEDVSLSISGGYIAMLVLALASLGLDISSFILGKKAE